MSLVMCVGLMVRPSPFVSALTTLSNWSPNIGIASTGTAWYTACSRLFCPPWVIKRLAFLWPGVNRKIEKTSLLRKRSTDENSLSYRSRFKQCSHNEQAF